MALPFLHIHNGSIVDESGKSVILKGVNLGGWLMMEGYILGGRNIPEHVFRDGFKSTLGQEALDDFTRSFRDTFIQEQDIKDIKKWGANCVRIPFNYRLIEYEDRPFSLNKEGLSCLDRAIDWCDAYGLYCILDMHAVPGAQNSDWHSDCAGTPAFFSDGFNQERYLRLWYFLADRYQDVSAVAAYDCMNEPVISVFSEHALKSIYEKVTEEIRSADNRHIIILEGNLFARRLKFLRRPRDPNTMYSIHAYLMHDFAFNWEPGLSYPGRSRGIMWNRQTGDLLGRQYATYLDKIGVPLYIGEFGVNWRGGSLGEVDYIKDELDVLKRYKFHWSYWLYKSIASAIFPDGIYRYEKNPAWVHRQGPASGWETFARQWPKEKGRMINSWRTENFARNDALYSLIQKYY